VVLVGAFAVGTAVAGPFFWYSCSLDGLQAQGPARASILLDRNGVHLGLLGASGNRQPVSLKRIIGQQAYGIEAAAHAYFGVDAKDLTLEQAALLAGLPQAPSAYDPLNRPDAAKARRTEVLRALLQSGDISLTRYRRAVDSPLGLNARQAPGSTGQAYLTDFITNQLVNEYGAERVRRGDLRIYTTLDAKMQTQATHAILGTLDRKGDPAGSVISIDPKTGQIRAMALAQTGERIAFDLPVDGQRQAGSTFKMFVLTKAVQREINPYSTRYLSAPFVGPNNWHVRTFENTYSGRIPLTQATLLSDNTVYARLALDLRPKPIAGLAHRMGIRSTLDPVPSIVLGVNAVSPLDLASAYATLADGGVEHHPTILAKVVFPDGHTESASQPRGKLVVDARVAGVVTRVLEANVQSGTGTAAALAGRPAAGKTGTTDSFADAWFAGWVPQLTTVTWVGYPTGERPMRGVHGIAGVTGGTLPAEIWHSYMTGALQGQPVEQFASPGSPPYKPWCGRYQFALTWRVARKHGGCRHQQRHETTTQPKTTTARTTTARTVTQTTTTRTVPTTTVPPPTTDPPPPPTTTQPPTTTTTGP
jgi:penicillin-binding protein 1A